MIRSNEGESAKIDLSISSFPRSTADLYWQLSISGLTKDDLATRFGDLSELIDLKIIILEEQNIYAVQNTAVALTHSNPFQLRQIN